MKTHYWIRNSAKREKLQAERILLEHLVDVPQIVKLTDHRIEARFGLGIEFGSSGECVVPALQARRHRGKRLREV